VVFGEPAGAQIISGMTVEPGDSMTGSVPVCQQRTNAGKFEMTITDTSRSNDSYTTYQTSSANQKPARHAEHRRVDRPKPRRRQPGQFQTLPDFGEVTFTDATAVIDGVSGAINSSSCSRRR